MKNSILMLMACSVLFSNHASATGTGPSQEQRDVDTLSAVTDTETTTKKNLSDLAKDSYQLDSANKRVTALNAQFQSLFGGKNYGELTDADQARFDKITNAIAYWDKQVRDLGGTVDSLKGDLGDDAVADPKQALKDAHQAVVDAKASLYKRDHQKYASYSPAAQATQASTQQSQTSKAGHTGQTSHTNKPLVPDPKIYSLKELNAKIKAAVKIALAKHKPTASECKTNTNVPNASIASQVQPAPIFLHDPGEGQTESQKAAPADAGTAKDPVPTAVVPTKAPMDNVGDW
jgi:hypothetical protein